MSMVLNNGFCEMTENEMMELEGGKWYDAIFAFGSGIVSTISVCGLLSGSGAGIATMGVGSLAACGPLGWAVLGVGVVGGVATGASTIGAAKK